MNKLAQVIWFPTFLAVRMTGFVIVETLKWFEELAGEED